MSVRLWTPRCAGRLIRKTVSPSAAVAWCHAARGRRIIPGSSTIPTANHKLAPEIQAQLLTGSQVETASCQDTSGDSSSAAFRA